MAAFTFIDVAPVARRWTLSVIGQRFLLAMASSSAGFALLSVVAAKGATFWAIR
jgi:hypothetical protein